MGQSVTMTDPRKSDYMYEEAIKNLRTNIQFAGRNVRCIMLTSCFPNEGKSDIAFQLAKEFGNMGKRVLLIDADIRKSSFINRYMVKQQVKGLSHYLCGQTGIGNVCYETNYPNVDIIFAGSTVPNPSELLEESAFSELIKYCRNIYDYILIDTPPVASMTDALIVAKWCDGTILVVESGRVRYRLAQKVKAQIARADCRMLGVVLNKVDVKNDRYYGRYGYYDYYYKKDDEK